MSIKKLKNVNSYDLLKTAAFLLMLIDHIGVYFYPDETWLRVIGRFCVPIWCFLIGYAMTRKIGYDLWLGVATLIIANIITGGAVFPITILLTFIIIRLALDPVARLGLASKERFIILISIIFIGLFPSMMLVEYGTAAFALALSGYAVRHGGVYAIPLYISGFIVFIFSQIVTFNFEFIQTMSLIAGVGFIAYGLWRFSPAEFPHFKNEIMLAVFKGVGRHTLILYVLHLILFKVIAASLALNGYAWFKMFLPSELP